MYGDDARVFNKEVPGAELTFQPENLAEYLEDQWDIRISIADMPLDEGFYIAVDNSSAVDEPIESLLDTYVLDPARRDELDIKGNPELPFIHEELIQYFENWRNGVLAMEFYINKNPEPGPIDLHRSARNYLSTCVYGDDTWDYMVLDIVLVPTVPEQSAYQLGNLKRETSEQFLLQLVNLHSMKGREAFNQFCRQDPIAYFLGASISSPDSVLHTELNNLYRKGLLKRDMASKPDPETGARYETGLTDQAVALLKQWHDELVLARTYDCFDSVSIAPPALGVPEGFDVRVQMLEYDGKDCMKSVLLCVLDENKDEFFDLDWEQVYRSGDYLQVVNSAMAFKTNFLSDILDELKALANENTDS